MQSLIALTGGVAATIAAIIALFMLIMGTAAPASEIITGGTTTPSSSQTTTPVSIWQEKLCTAHLAITDQSEDNIFSILKISSPQSISTANNPETFILEAWRQANNNVQRSAACLRVKKGGSEDKEDLYKCRAREQALALSFNAVRDERVRTWWAEQSDAWRRTQKKGSVIDEEQSNKVMSEAVRALCLYH